MGDYDFLAQEPSQRPAVKRLPGGRGTTAEPGKAARTAPSSRQSGRSQTQSAASANTKPGVNVQRPLSGPEVSAASINRELEKEGIFMTPMQELEKQAEIERAEGREAIIDKQAEYEKRVKVLQSQIGEQYKHDLVMQPPMWAAQDLQAGYPARQERTANNIMAVEIPRIVRVLEAAGITLTKAKPEAPEK